MPTAIIIGLALIVGVIVAVANGGKSSKKNAQSSGEIFLQPASQPGPDPFGPSTAAPLTPSTHPSSSVVAPPSSSAAGPLVLSAKSGGTPELYGGSKRLSVCDKPTMIAYLQSNPSKGAAWAAVQGITTSELPAYINSLTPVVLRSDTRVTNHGYASGHATAFQAILQAGTAVLVDQYGVPRARCACGNPLVAPIAVQTKPKYQGPPWPGFTPANVTVINKSTTIINVIIVIDIETGQPVNIPLGPGAGPIGSGSSSPPSSSPPSSAPPSSAAPGGGWRLINIKAVPIQGQPEYSVSTPFTSTGGGVTVMMSDNGYLCGGSGGAETVTYSWTFGRDITDLANGDTFQASVNAVEDSKSGACTGGLAARSGINIGTSSGGSLPQSAFDRPAEPERFTGATQSAAADQSQGAKPSESATLGVASTPSDPSKPESGFVATIQGPGYEFMVLYVYEQVT